jgi:hypothetical protein
MELALCRTASADLLCAEKVREPGRIVIVKPCDGDDHMQVMLSLAFGDPPTLGDLVKIIRP